MNGENFSAFRYGFLSAQLSSVLQEYLDTHVLSASNKEKLVDGNALLRDIVTAQKTFVSKNEADRSTAPTYHELDAFNCALNVILANRSTFAVNDVPSFTQFFDSMYQTLRSLVEEEGQSGSLDMDCVTKARVFFEKLADAMLALMSFPAENITDPNNAYFVLA